MKLEILTYDSNVGLKIGNYLNGRQPCRSVMANSRLLQQLFRLLSLYTLFKS